jgi:uncharacterized protein (TIRG00374 family)
MLAGLRLVGAGLLVALLVFVVDLDQLWKVLIRMEPAWAALAVAANLPVLALKGERWRWLLDGLELKYPYRRAWVAFTASLAAGIVTPGRVGEVVRVAYLKNDAGANPGVALFSVVVDRLLDLLVLAIVGGAGLAVWQLRWHVPWWAWLLLGPLVAVPLLIVVPPVRRRALQWLKRRRKVRPDTEKRTDWDLRSALVDSTARLGTTSGKRALAAGLLLSGLAFGVLATQAWFLAQALGLSLGWVDVALMLALANLVGSLPLSVAGVGTREAVLVVLMGARLIPPESALALGAAFLLCNVVVCFALGLAAWEIWPPVRKQPPVNS